MSSVQTSLATSVSTSATVYTPSTHSKDIKQEVKQEVEIKTEPDIKQEPNSEGGKQVNYISFTLHRNMQNYSSLIEKMINIIQIEKKLLMQTSDWMYKLFI